MTSENVFIVLIDKLIIGVILILIAQFLKQQLVRFSTDQGKQLEQFRSAQTKQLDELRRMHSEQLEQFKIDLLSQMEAARLTREALGKLAQKVAAATHAMAWLTWTARYAATDFQAGHLATYDQQLYESLSEIVGARVVLATLDDSVHDRVGEHVVALYKLDHDISLAKALYPADPQKCREQLAGFHPQVLAFDRKTLEVMSSAISALTRSTANRGSAPTS